MGAEAAGDHRGGRLGGLEDSSPRTARSHGGLEGPPAAGGRALVQMSMMAASSVPSSAPGLGGQEFQDLAMPVEAGQRRQRRWSLQWPWAGGPARSRVRRRVMWWTVAHSTMACLGLRPQHTPLLIGQVRWTGPWAVTAAAARHDATGARDRNRVDRRPRVSGGRVI
jgi:hypothetical protein